MARRGSPSKAKRLEPMKSASSADQSVQRKIKMLVTTGVGLLLIVALIGSIIATSIGSRVGDLDASTGPQAEVVTTTMTTLHNDFDLEPKTLNELLNIPDSEIHKVDIARMNLLCATGVPDTQGLDVEHALSVLDEWAEKVAFETKRHLYRVTDPRYQDRYRGSEPHFRAEMLAQVLQEELGVHYNKSAIGNFSFADPSVAFIHGMIPEPGKTTGDTPGGTCASMPVLYVAVGRRLGYPLKLATTHSHIFARWDGEALYQQECGHENPAWVETFNCETTNGFTKHDDKHYRTWPFPVTEHQIAYNGFLKSLSPFEEFAQFLGARGHYGMDVGQPAFAARCYENAHRYDRSRPCYTAWFMKAARKSNYQPYTVVLRRMVETDRHRQASLLQEQASGRTHGIPRPSQFRSQARTGGVPTVPGSWQPAHQDADPFHSPYTVGRPIQQPVRPPSFQISNISE